jgi:hypothetical protein
MGKETTQNGSFGILKTSDRFEIDKRLKTSFITVAPDGYKVPKD